MEFTREQAIQKDTESQKAGKAKDGIPTRANILVELKLDKALKLAKSKVQSGLSNEAKKIYQDILKKFPKNKKALVGMKTLASKTLATYSDIQEPPKEQLNSLLKLYNQQKLKQVFNEAQILTNRYSKSLILWNLMGTSAAQIGNLDDAVHAFQQALSIKPDDAQVYYNMGNALKDQEKLEEAIDAYKKALSIKPDYADAYLNIGTTLKDQGNLEEAIEAYKKALSIKPDYAEVHYNIGTAHNDRGKLEDAIEAYKKALSIKPDHAEAYFNIGNALKDQKKLEEAIEAYKKAASIKPDYTEAYNNTGVAFQQQGKLQEAIEAYTKALSIMPNFCSAKMNLSTAKQRAVPNWHLKMMNDLDRNDAYLKALKLAISDNDLVLEIGTGSGLLAMMSADAGAKKVITCEASKTIAGKAEEIISQNGYSNKITVIDKKSTDLLVGKDLPNRADIIVSEILSSEFVGEGIQPTIVDANKRLLAKNGKMLPESGDIRIALLGDSKEIKENIYVKDINGFDFSKFNSIIGNKFSLSLKNKPNFLSETEIAFKFDLYGSKIKYEEEKILSLKANKSGLCYGVIQWLGLQIFKEVKYENRPGEIPSHWPTPIYRFDEPLYVVEGQEITIKATLLEDKVWFSHHK